MGYDFIILSYVLNGLNSLYCFCCVFNSLTSVCYLFMCTQRINFVLIFVHLSSTILIVCIMFPCVLNGVELRVVVTFHMYFTEENHCDDTPFRVNQTEISDLKF